MSDTIDSNLTGLAFAEESALKTLPDAVPDSGAQDGATWFEMEPNSYSDFGGNINSVSRAPINASRQRKKGTPVGLDASAGFSTDFTQNNITRLLQGFFFADAREKADTQPFNGTSVAITNVDSVNKDYEAASGLDAFAAGDLVLASGFTNAANNGVKLVTAAVGGSLTVSEALTAEAAPPAAARIQAVGFQFNAGDATLTAAASGVTLGATAKDLTELGLTPGEWVFIGGDLAAEQFATALCGYARVKTIAADAIVFDETTFTAATNAGAAKTVRIYFGKVIRNEQNPSLIKTRSYQWERKLGNDNDGTQAEYLTGSIPNELAIQMPMEDKITCDLSFVSLDNEQRTGAEGLKAGTRVSALGEAALNTSLNMYRVRLAIAPSDTINGTPLFGYVQESNITINNGVTKTGALGVFGGIGASLGDFQVGGEITAYFSTVEAVRAIRNNADVEYNVIVAKDNAGFVIDIPLLGLGGGRANVEKDQKITLPLETNAAENALGYTAMFCHFPYLPSVGMPE